MSNKHPIDRLRRLSGERWNIALDEYAAGDLSRRSLIKYAGLLGLTGVAGFGLKGQAFAATDTPGGTIRVALDQPTGAIDPVLVTDPPTIGVLSQVGEYLLLDDAEKGLQPQLAVSWSGSEDVKNWIFKLRPGVKFHDGRPLTAKDVVATFERLVDPASGSAALSAYKGLLSKGGVRAVDDSTVVFTLDAPNSNFPYYVSSDVYNAIILPADYAGDFQKTFIGTGPFKLEAFQPKQKVSFIRNPDYWGEKALPDRVEITFFDDPQAQVIALQAGQVDIIPYTTRSDLAITGKPDFQVLSVKASTHDQVHLRTDQAVFQDKRVRRALALTIDREAVTKGLLKGRGVVGNDSPFAPNFASTDLSVPQRKQDLAEAKRLLAEAGVPNGFPVTLTTERAYEIPDYAVLIQNFAKKVGIEVTLNVLPQDAYYGAATFGNSPWLDSTLGITDYGHRGTPEIVANAAFKSTGSWNAAHFKNPQYDQLLLDYSKATDLKAQRETANKIQTLLLDETPVIISYFSNYNRIASTRVRGLRFSAISHIFLHRVTLA